MTKQLLIIDDSKSILSVISYIFSHKFEVVKKNNGLEAWTWIQEGNIPDIIVCDINMPEMDGWEFLKNLKANSLYEDIPVIILSTIDSTPEKIRFLKLGVEDYLVKPFNPEELDARIENILRRAEKYTKV